MPIGRAIFRTFSATPSIRLRFSTKKLRYLNTARLPIRRTSDAIRNARDIRRFSLNLSMPRPHSHATSVDASIRNTYFGSPHE